MDIRIGKWIISLYRAGSLKTVVSDLAKYDLYPVAVQQVI